MPSTTSTHLLPVAGRIGLDGDALRKPLSGVGQYVFNLCRELDKLLPQAQFFVYTRLAADQIAVPSERWTVRRETFPLLRKLPSFVWLKTRGAYLAGRDHLDLFWAGRTIHPGRGCAQRIAITVHDLNHRLVPDTMERATLYSHRLWFDRDVRSADVVFANSQGTSDRLQDWIGRSADVIVHPGVRPDFQPLDEQARQQASVALAEKGVVPPYFLAVSTLEPRKNIAALVDAFIHLRRQGALAGHQLVLVGAKGWQNRELAARIEAHADLGVVLPGYIPDEQMPGVFALAEALVMPSIYEGYGMPVLEARAVGTPVIVSDVPELREAAGGHASALASTVEEIAAALLRQAANPTGQPRAVLGDIQSWRCSAAKMSRQPSSSRRLKALLQNNAC